MLARKQAKAAEASTSSAETSAAAPTSEVPATTPIEPEDLAKIEGIGPKITGLLQEAGIKTFAQLAVAGVSQLEAILDKAGPRYQMANPATWPEQARLAAEGKWDELAKLQDSLKGGRQV
jgi:large subunit ribosomal protein L17